MFGLTRQTYRNYENGKTQPPLEVAGKLAVYFRCSIADLFDLPEGQNLLSDIEKRLISLYASLSDTGRVKLIEYAEDLVDCKHYKR